MWQVPDCAWEVGCKWLQQQCGCSRAADLREGILYVVVVSDPPPVMLVECMLRDLAFASSKLPMGNQFLMYVNNHKTLAGSYSIEKRKTERRI